METDIPKITPEKTMNSDSELLENMKDSNPKTWINEDVWKTFFVMMMFYSVSAFFKAGTITADNTFTISWVIFWVAIDSTMLPLFGAAMRNQIMKGANSKLEDQNRAFAIQKVELKTENQKLKSEIKTLSDSKNIVQEELYKVRAELNAKCENLQIMKEANGLANDLLKTFKK